MLRLGMRFGKARWASTVRRRQAAIPSRERKAKRTDGRASATGGRRSEGIMETSDAEGTIVGGR